MKNEPEYIKYIEDAAHIKKDLRNIFQPRISILKKLFRLKFRTKGNIFTFLNNIKFFEKEDHSRHKEILDKVGVLFTYYKLIGEDQIYNEYLQENYGITISEVQDGEIASRIEKQAIFKDERSESKFEKLWADNLSGRNLPSNPKEVLRILLAEGQFALADVVEETSKIKKVSARNVEENCEVKGSLFVKAVNLRANELEKGDVVISDYKKKIEHGRAAEDEAIRPIIT